MSWALVYTKQAQKDAKKLTASNLRDKAQTLLDLIQTNPFQNPPPYEKLVGDLLHGSLLRCARLFAVSGSTLTNRLARLWLRYLISAAILKKSLIF